MSLSWILKSINPSKYENNEPITHGDLDIIKSETFSPSFLIHNLIGTNQDISSLILETLELSDDTKLEILEKVTDQIVPNTKEFSWDATSGAMRQFQHNVVFKLRLLNKVPDIESIPSELSQKLIIHLSYNTYPETPWCNSRIAKLATICLEKFSTTVNDLILSYLTKKAMELNKISKFNSNLQKRNELFKNINPNIGFFKTSSIELDTWKSENLPILSTLYYVISSDSTTELQVIVPLLLNFLDDHEVQTKELSNRLLEQLLKQDHNILRYKEIFKDSLQKCLLYLPSLTPVDKSLHLLTIAYKNLLALIEEDRRELISLIDDHILPSIISVHDKSFEILEFLFELLLVIVPIVSFKLVSVLSKLNAALLNVLIDPYVVSHESLLIKDIQLLMTIIKYNWPVMDKYKYDYVSGIVLCFKKLDAVQNKAVVNELKKLLQVVSKCCKGVDDDFIILVENDPSLIILLSDKV